MSGWQPPRLPPSDFRLAFVDPFHRTKCSVEAITRRVISLLAAVVVSCSAHADALDVLNAALAARVSGDFDAAISLYTLPIETSTLLSDTVAVVLASRGIAYDTQGQINKVIADFARAIELKPNPRRTAMMAFGSAAVRSTIRSASARRASAGCCDRRGSSPWGSVGGLDGEADPSAHA